jgi:hypothetical protein
MVVAADTPAVDVVICVEDTAQAGDDVDYSQHGQFQEFASHFVMFSLQNSQW